MISVGTLARPSDGDEVRDGRNPGGAPLSLAPANG